jgi:hypothetical protein
MVIHPLIVMLMETWLLAVRLRKTGAIEMSGRGFLEAEPDGKCELCKKIAETRPYGPNGERVCFECGMKDEAAAERQFDKLVLGKGVH